jgi:hypothetical protein
LREANARFEERFRSTEESREDQGRPDERGSQLLVPRDQS